MLKVHLQVTDLLLLLVLRYLVVLCFDFDAHHLVAQMNEVSAIFKKHLINVSEKLHLLLFRIDHQFYLASFTGILMKLVSHPAPLLIQPCLLYQDVQVSFIELVVVKWPVLS